MIIDSSFSKRLLQIGWKNDAASAFFYERADRQYIVTAKHVLEGFSGKEAIHVLHGGEWKPTTPRLIGFHDDDVAVLACDALSFSTDRALPEDDPHVGYGQDAYFLGFPFEMFGDLGGLNNGYPHPFVKRAIVSSFSEGGGIIYLDGINNSGFSGGMVIAQNVGNGPMRIVGVISGYVGAEQQVQRRGRTTNLTIQENTGLIRMAHIGRANGLFDQNPDGRRL